MTVVITIYLLAFAAYTVIAATMGRHQEDLGTASFTRGQLLRWRLAGYALLAASFYPSLSRWGLSIAIAAWVSIIGFTGITFGLAQTYFPQVNAVLKRAVVLVGTMLGSFASAPLTGEKSQTAPAGGKVPPKAPPKAPPKVPPKAPPKAPPDAPSEASPTLPPDGAKPAPKAPPKPPPKAPPKPPPKPAPVAEQPV